MKEQHLLVLRNMENTIHKRLITWVFYNIWKKYTPSEFLPDRNTDYTSGDSRIFSQLHPPLLMNEHKHPFGLITPNYNVF